MPRQIRFAWLIAFIPMVAAACRLYSDELLNSQAIDKQARDAGATVAARCGDGKISGPEKCDVGISRGEPGACPTECPALASCAPRVLQGTACEAECELLVVECGPRDDCCPADCLPASDADCSSSCGDGIVDAEGAETCEPNSKAPCPMSQDVLWGHSVGVATFARQIAVRAAFQDKEGPYMAGLMHDIGKPIVAIHLLDLERSVSRSVQDHWIEPNEWLNIVQEVQRPVGMAVAKAWNMSPETCKAVKELGLDDDGVAALSTALRAAAAAEGGMVA